MNSLFKWMLFFVVTFCSGVSFAETAHSELSISNIMARNAEKTDVILADKSQKTLYVISADGDNFTVKASFPIIYGINEGDKKVSGDGKTPEGVYYITSWTSGESLINRYGNYAKIYGSGAFPLNYPNSVDKIRKKTGHGIWIHGRDPINGKDTTQGCIALHNEDLMNLYSMIAVKDAVVITDKALLLSKGEYDALRSELLGVFDGFINSWQSNDYESFKNYIHNNFKGQGKNAKSYLSSKKYLMEQYKDKTIKTDNTKIFIQNDNNFLVDTNQFYCAKNVTSYGKKRYYFTKESEGFKLVSEEAVSLSPNKIISDSINSFLENWAAAWRSGDVDKYAEFYSENFKNGKMNKSAWYNYKKDVFQKAGTISVELSDISWSAENNLYKAYFIQKYSGGSVSDIGIKTLVFDGCPDNFKIISETWTAN